MGLRYVALRPTLAEYVLDMPRGAQVIYPTDRAMILFWADIYPGCRVLEAGTGSGALTLALLRAVGPEGRIITFEQREEFARRALANIHMRLGEVTNLTVRLRPVEDGLAEEPEVDRVLRDLPEPWKLTTLVADKLRPGGIFLCYVPTIVQSHQGVDAHQRERHGALIQTCGTLHRPRRYGRAYQSCVNMCSQNSRQPITPELAERLGLDRQVMDVLVQEALVVQRARAEGLEATDDEVNAEINAQSVFHENGRFTRRRFEAVLQRAGICESAYVEGVRREMTAQRVRGLRTSGAEGTPPG